MNDNTTANDGSVSASTSLYDNVYIKEVFGILKDNGKDTTGLTALINHITNMENIVKIAESRIAQIESQLSKINEIQNHPIRNVLQGTKNALERKVAGIKEQLAELKIKIINGCKNAITAFKDKGADALDKLASFFKIKNGLQSISKDIDDCIKLDNKAIAKIETFSKEYHETGRHLHNLVRTITGKPLIDTAKESGKLAKTISAPYKADRAIQLKMKAVVTSMIKGLEHLEQRAAAKRETKSAEKTTTTEKKPSLEEKLRANKEIIKQKDLEKPTPIRTKAQGIEA